MNRTNSIKRSGEDHPFQRPAKRSTSPRNSQLYVTPPTTPKKPSRLNSLNPKGRLITSFQKVFNKSSFGSLNSNLLSPESPNSSILSTSPKSATGLFSNHKFLPTPLTTPSSRRVSTESEDAVSIKSYTDEKSICYVNEDFNHQLSNLTLRKEDSYFPKVPEPHQIFTMPEILLKILSYVDDFTTVPHEDAPIRRRPLSYQHALLIYKDEKKASQVWNEAVNSTKNSYGTPTTTFSTNGNSLFNCFFVNKLWYQVSLEIASTKFFFMDISKWSNFVQFQSKNSLKRSNSNTKLFVLHKLSKVKQADIEKIATSISGQLEWIEMYICPKVLPTPSMLSGLMLKKLILPGSNLVNDSFLKLVAKNCPLLENLDLRECVLVSDIGVCSISSHCKQLKFLNLGRHTNSELITDKTLSSIASNNCLISTLGLAGSSITDRGLWELSISCSQTIQRLSLNKCLLLTNNSIPIIIKNGYLDRLSVLEIRHNLALTNLKPLVEFKRNKQITRGQLVLIEGCEVLEYRMRKEEWKLDMKRSAMMFNDIKNWCNDENDGDLSYAQLQCRKLL